MSNNQSTPTDLSKGDTARQPGRNLRSYPSWPALTRHASALLQTPLAELCSRQGSRFDELSRSSCGLTLDLSKQRLTPATLPLLRSLGQEAELPAAVAAMFRGDRINGSEQRAVMHTALRGHPDNIPVALRAAIVSTLAQIEALSNEVRTGGWRGFTGRPITDVVHIGIGGSYLGPRLVVEALSRQPEAGLIAGPRTHFVANIDGSAVGALTDTLNPETTLIVVVSKSFSTIETLTNARVFRSWLLERGATQTDLANHFVAVSANVERATGFGIAAANVLPMWDSVGGRYSVWSAVGLPIALQLGYTVFEALLSGARAMDEHFLTAPMEQNLPMLAGLAEVFEHSCYGADSHAVVCYDHRLRSLAEHLQQVSMESNGKSVTQSDQPVRGHTAPILWGGEGTNGQHAYFQLMHQGTRAIGIELVLVANGAADFPEHSRALLANGLAQGDAFLRGREHAEPQRVIPGGRPMTTLVLDTLTTQRLGSLLAYYEHKVFVQGVMWGINSFDQWGVELGKVLAEQITDELCEQRAAPRADTTQDLINHIISLRA